MAVNIQSKTRARMAQTGADRLDVQAAGDQKGGMAMSQTMEIEVRQACSLFYICKDILSRIFSFTDILCHKVIKVRLISCLWTRRNTVV